MLDSTERMSDLPAEKEDPENREPFVYKGARTNEISFPPR